MKRLWCKLFHRYITNAYSGHYMCKRCWLTWEAPYK